MRDKSTLFILGAGAHMPYGFPSGKKLITDIIYGVKDEGYAKKELGLDHNLEELLTEKHRIIDKGLLSRFIAKLRESGQLSIDKFLSLDTVSEDVGKILLIIILSIYEYQNNPHGENLSAEKFSELRNQSVYHIIVDSLNLVNNGSINNSIKYITFNYDRCLEYFLYKTYKNSYGIDFDKSAEYLDDQIIHIHGSIGKFNPPNYPAYSDRVHYGPEGILNENDPFLAGLTGLIDNFQIAFNSDYSSKAEKVSEFLKSADEIIFLGFAYAKENLKALSLYKDGNYKEKNIYCCTLGLTERKVRSLENRFKSIFENSSITIDKSRNKDGATFLNEHWVI